MAVCVLLLGLMVWDCWAAGLIAVWAALLLGRLSGQAGWVVNLLVAAGLLGCWVGQGGLAFWAVGLLGWPGLHALGRAVWFLGCV